MKVGNYSSKLFGDITIITKNGKLTGLNFGKVTSFINEPEEEIVQKVLLALNENIIDPSLPIELSGSDFQIKVWESLRKIPSGTVTTYKKIAQDIGHPNAFRAVGTACGTNPIAMIVPCHRVISSNGSLGGYHWGLDLKNKLLIREGYVIR